MRSVLSKLVDNNVESDVNCVLVTGAQCPFNVTDATTDSSLARLRPCEPVGKAVDHNLIEVSNEPDAMYADEVLDELTHSSCPSNMAFKSPCIEWTRNVLSIDPEMICGELLSWNS